MKFLKSMLLAISVILFFDSAWSMEEHCFSNVPEGPVLEIFIYLDIQTAIRLARAAKHFYKTYNNQKENLWAAKAQEHFGEYALDLKGANSFEELIKAFYLVRKFAQDTLNMKSWPQEKIEQAVADMANSVTSNLLADVEFEIFETARDLKINRVKDFSCFLGAYSEICLNMAEQATFTIAINAANALTLVAGESYEANLTKANNAVCQTPLVKIFVSLEVVQKAIRYPNSKVDSERDVARDAVKSAVAKLEYISNEDAAFSTWKLSSFFVLASIAQSQSVKKLLVNAYYGAWPTWAINYSDETKEKVISKLCSLWEKGELSNNPHIKSLKKIVQVLAKHVED